MLGAQPDSATGLIVRNFESCTLRGTGTPTAFIWAEYEYRRRCHFALELMLSALTRSLADFEVAGIEQIVSGWLETLEASSRLNEIWPDMSAVIGSNVIAVVESIPKDLFSNQPVPVDDLRRLPTTDQAFAAVALLVAVASQTRGIRKDGYFDRRTASPGERAIGFIETAGQEPFSGFLMQLAELTALSHLQTTLRKMGSGQKCSLRFFPDGPLLRSTGMGMEPGHSNDRLTNVLRILTDVGMLERSNGKFAPAKWSAT